MTPKNTPQNPITLFLLACAGVDMPTLEKSPSSENAKLVGIGGAIFLTAVMALVSGSFAIQIATKSWLMAIPAGVIYALIIFNLDRYIVNSIDKTAGELQQYKQAVPRIILALIFAFSISKPLELALFSTEINTERAKVVDQEIQTAVDSITLLINDLEAKNDTLRNNPFKNSEPISGASKSFNTAKEKEAQTKKDNELKLISLQEKINNLVADRKELREQGNSTIRVSNNINALVKERRLLEREITAATKTAETDKKALSDEKEQLKTANASKTKANERRIERLQKEIETVNAQRTEKIEGHKGLLADIETLSNLGQSSWTMWWTEFLVFLLLVAIEVAPIFVKLTSPAGHYDHSIKKSRDFKSEAEFNKNQWLLGSWSRVAKGKETILVFEKEKLTLISDGKRDIGKWKHLASEKFQLDIQKSKRLVLISKSGESMIIRELQQPNYFMQFNRSSRR